MGILPTKKRSPVIDLRTLNVLVYGQPGVGKSTLASQAPDALFFACEDGVKTMEVFEHPCRNWETVQAGVDELVTLHKDPQRPFRTVVIDTVDNLLLFASQHVCKSQGWVHESDGEYGKGFGLVKTAVKETLLRISNLRDESGEPSYGLWMISHSKEIEVKNRGDMWQKTVPSMSDSQRKIIEGFADLIVYADVEWDDEKEAYQRLIRTRPSPYYVAKDRTGHLPETISLSLNTPTGYDRILQALQEAVPGKASPSNGTSSSRPPQREEPQEDPVSPDPDEATEPPQAPPSTETPVQEDLSPEAPPEPETPSRPEPPKVALEIWDLLDAIWPTIGTEDHAIDEKEATANTKNKKLFLEKKLRTVMDDRSAEWTREWLSEHSQEGGMDIAWKYLKRETLKKVERELKKSQKGGSS